MWQGETPSRRYAQRVRWRRLPPIEAMFRSCSEALSSNARETAGYRWTTLGVRATEIAEAVIADCRAFAGELGDDCAVVVIKKTA